MNVHFMGIINEHMSDNNRVCRNTLTMVNIIYSINLNHFI